MIFALKQVHSPIAKTLLPPPAKFFSPNDGNLPQAPRGLFKEGNLEGLPPPGPPTPMAAVTPPFNPRCKMKGCVFPASDLATGMCHCHDLQESEPEFFQSYQPILYVLQQAKFGISDPSMDDGHVRQRRALVLRRKASLKGVA